MVLSNAKTCSGCPALSLAGTQSVHSTCSPHPARLHQRMVVQFLLLVKNKSSPTERIPTMISTYSRSVPHCIPMLGNASLKHPHAHPLSLFLSQLLATGWGIVEAFHLGIVTTIPVFVMATTSQFHSYASLPISSNCGSAISDGKLTCPERKSEGYIPRPGQSRGTGGRSSLSPRGPSGTRSDQTGPGLWRVSGRQMGK